MTIPNINAETWLMFYYFTYAQSYAMILDFDNLKQLVIFSLY